jgi:Tfp pilus assembly protein PilF
MSYRELKDWVNMKASADHFFRVLTTVQENHGQFGYIVQNTTGEAWRVYLALGDYYLAQEDAHQAENAFHKALSVATVRFECLKIMADFYKNHGLWRHAASLYRQAIEEKEDYPEAVLGLALAENRVGEKEKAIKHYERVLELRPDAVEALVNLGDLYCERGEEERGKAFYKRALDIESSLVQVSLRLAKLSVKKGDIEACVGQCENILRTLGLPCNHSLESLSDLAELFLIIGHDLDKAGRDNLFRDAIEVALTLDPELMAAISK